MVIAMILACTLSGYCQTVSNSSDSGAGSLRDAIESAQEGATITFDAGITEIMIESVIEITKNINIRKESGNRVRINAGFQTRILDIRNASVGFYNINFANGNTVDGGAMRLNNSQVSVDNCRFENSVASGTMGRGGAIFIDNGSTASISNSVFQNNWSNSTGGAIADNSGDGNGLNLDNVQFIDNRVGVAPLGSQPGSGGALFIYGRSMVNISNCIFTENEAASEGGAIWNSAGDMNISNSSFIDNSIESLNSSRGGGALYNNSGTINIERSVFYENLAKPGANGGALSNGADGQINILTSTLAFNQSDEEGGAIYSAGGGIFLNACTVSQNINGNEGAGLSLMDGGRIKNSIVASNGPSGNTDIDGNITSQGYNIIGSGSGFTMNVETGDRINTDPLLDALIYENDSRIYFPLMFNSPAYNGGDPADGFSDQLGQPVFGGVRDAGAFEAQDILSSIEETQDKSVMLYPNPASDYVFISDNNLTEYLNVDIYDADGRKVAAPKPTNHDGMDISHLPKGIYFLMLQKENESFMAKFIKE